MTRAQQRRRAFAFSLLSAAAVADVLLPLGIGRHGWHFNTPDDPAQGGGAAGGTGGTGGTGAAAGGTGAGNEPEPAGDPPAAGGTYPARQYHDVDRKRKRYTQAFKALLKQIGVSNPDAVKVRQTNDPANPIAFDGIEDLEQRTAAARMAAQLGVSGGTGGRGGRQQQQSADAQQLQLQVNAYKAQNSALVEFIKRAAVIEPIRAECLRLGAIDDDNGKFSDIVNMLAPRFKPEVEFDAENAAAAPTVRIDCVDDNGQPLINPNTQQPLTPAEVVADFLNKRPKYRKAEWRSGPGAGGAAVGAGQQRRTGGTAIVGGNNHQQSDRPAAAHATAGFFGLPIETIDERAPRGPVAPARNGNGSR